MKKMIRDLLGPMAETVPVLVHDGKTWYAAHAVCGIYGIKNTSIAMRKILPQEKAIFRGHNGVRVIRYWYITEEGLYRLISTCRTPESQTARNLLFRDILPKHASRTEYRRA